MISENNRVLLGELIQTIHDLGHGGVPFVSSDMDLIRVHFIDIFGEDIGNLPLYEAIHGMWNNVDFWHECSTDRDEETGEPTGDLNTCDAVRVKLQSN